MKEKPIGITYDYKYWEYTEDGRAIKSSGIRKMTLLVIELENGKFVKDEHGMYKNCHAYSICIPKRGIPATKEFKWKYKKELHKKFMSDKPYEWQKIRENRTIYWNNVRITEDPTYGFEERIEYLTKHMNSYFIGV